MDIRKLIFPLRKWWWLLLLSTLVAAGASYAALQGAPERYQARTTILVGTAIENPNPTGTELLAGEQLAAAYAEIGGRDQVRNQTKEALGLEMLPEYVVQALPRTQFLEIVVTDRIPERAMAVADELANQLISISPTSFSADEQTRLDTINTQLDQIEADIAETQLEIDQVRTSLGVLTSAAEIDSAQQQLNALQSKMNTLNTTYASLLASSNQEGINRLTIIEPAALPTEPSGPGLLLTVGLAAAIGFTLSLAAVYLIEYWLDNTIKFPDDVETIYGKSIIGHIFSTVGIKRDKIPISKYTTHPTAESFRSLKTNLLFMGKNSSLKTILVACPDKQPAKNQFIIHLALALAEGGKKVILVDADLRVPELHTFFQIGNPQGLGEVLTNKARLEEVIQPVQEGYFSVVVAGQKHADAVEWLDSPRMEAAIEALKEKADIVIFNAPPYFVADAAILGAKMDGVLAVVRPGVTKKEAVVNMAEQLEVSEANLLGITLIEIPNWGATYFARVPNNRYYTA